MAPRPVSFWKTGLRIPKRAIGDLRGRLFLALLPKALKQSVLKSSVLAAETKAEQGA